MRFLITGANGFVGKALCAELARRGHFVRAAVREVNQPIENIAIASVGSIDGVTDWTAALSNIDVVIHLAARVHVMQDTSEEPLEEFRKVNVQGTENLARQTVDSGVKRLVYVSSIGVNGLQTKFDNIFTETDTVNPHNAYAISKWEAEQKLLQICNTTGLDVVVIRPPLIYGADAPGNFAKMIKVISKGIPLPLASACNRRSLIYIGNLVDALILCAIHPDAAGQTYLVSDGEDISTPELLLKLGLAMDKQVRLFSVPKVLLYIAAHFTGKNEEFDRLFGSLKIDSKKIRNQLKWQPPYKLKDGLNLTGQAYCKK
jgi:nucleoside-diphosphate-sugar epimerase